MFKSTNTGSITIPPRLFEITLPASQDSSPGVDLARSYQLKASSTNIGKMLENCYRGAEERLQQMVVRGLSSEMFAGGKHLSLRKVLINEVFGQREDSARSPTPEEATEVIRFCNKKFDKVTGAIRLPDDIEWRGFSSGIASRFDEFFSKPGRTTPRNGSLHARGACFYASVDEFLTTNDKLNSIRNDLDDAIKLLRLVNQEDLTPVSFWLTLGVLDYAKNHSLALYNAVTFDERKGHISQDSDYISIKAKSHQLAEVSTTTYYKFLNGFDITIPELSLRTIGNSVSEIVDFLKSRKLEQKALKLQECDHPLVIALHAHENALKFSDTETIIALPLGGLQSGFVTRWAFNKIWERNPSLIVVPLSTHAGVEKQQRHLTADEIVDHILFDSVRGKQVLVTEDNTNTGNTAQIISKAVEKARAASVSVAIIEKDPRRIFVKQALRSERESNKPEFATIANLDHPDFQTAVRAVPVLLRIPGPNRYGVQAVKMIADKVLRQYYDKATAPQPRPPSQDGSKAAHMLRIAV